MRKLDRVTLINAAGFDYLEFPVGGHAQVIGVNGHGKSTLLRTILFFYLGTNNKADYALHETKVDFVSYYLGDPPSYLIYEVARDDGEPGWHVAATRPAGRIQFHFVDAPFRREYYVDGNLVQPIDAVHSRLREAKCAFETVLSYEEFHRRVYGIAPSAFSVFSPASRSSGQVGILPRIISGIFTVSQLDADKLKSALTCGVRSDALTTEIDLVLLKNQLENFRRVNRAVKVYLRHEQDAIDLVTLAEEFETVKADRQRAIEDFIRMAKRLPGELAEIEKQKVDLESEVAAERARFQSEDDKLTQAILELEKDLAVVKVKIRDGETAEAEYQKREIDKKSRELELLSGLAEQKRVAEEEYKSLTAKYEDENQRKEGILATLRESWEKQRGELERRKAACADDLLKASERLTRENEASVAALEREHQDSRQTLAPRRTELSTRRAALNREFVDFSKIGPPKELEESRKAFAEIKRKQQEEVHRQERLRNEIEREKERAERDREKIERDAAAERTELQAQIEHLSGKRDQVAAELDAFDESLARLFQTEIPDAWPDAAKTLNRETLFRRAANLNSRRSSAESSSVWGMQISTAKLPDPQESYERDDLARRLQDLRKELSQKNDLLQAAQERFLAATSELEKRVGQTRNRLAADLDSSNNLRRRLLEDGERLDNKILTLDSQYNEFRRSRQEALEKQDTDLRQEEQRLQLEENDIEARFRSRKSDVDQSFRSQREQLAAEAASRRAVIEAEETEARQKRDAKQTRIEDMFRETLTKKGVDTSLIKAAGERVEYASREIERISRFDAEVREYGQKKRDLVDPLPALRARRQQIESGLAGWRTDQERLRGRHEDAKKAFEEQKRTLDARDSEIKSDREAVDRFRRDLRFVQELGYPDREELEPASFFRAGAVREYLISAERLHEQREKLGTDGNANARRFLNKFDAETLNRKILGFSPIHEHFDWYIFVGNELRPFVDNRGIHAMTRIQTREFEQLVRTISAKNADFREGIRQVKQTADLVEAHLRENNFVDVLDSVELKVERVDSPLTQTLVRLEEFQDVSFGNEGDLFGKSADRAQIDRAIETFERLLRDIDDHRGKRLQLTDYFDFFIRVHENGHDMGWKKSLDHIGSTGTDYLVKMLIYLSLIEVYRERAIDPTKGSTVHCVMDETGVLAQKYVRSVLEYAATRGIILITAGHSQQTVGFQNWVLVRKRGQRFGGQTILRKVLRCD